MRFSLLQPLLDIPIAVIDTETTGASAAFGHKIIEVGIVRIERGQAVAEYQQLIDPARRISAGVTALTGIAQSMVEGQPRFRDQLPAMLSLLNGAAIMGHNIRFDLSFLSAEFRRAGMDMKETLGAIPVLDTVKIARRRFGRGGNSLPNLSVRLGVDPVLSHRALADARTTHKVFEKLIEPVGGYNLSLCDTLAHQGGPMDLTPRNPSEPLLPLELEEALDAAKPVIMEYVDARGSTTQRMIQPLHIRRVGGELIMVAHCHLRSDRRTFKLDRIVRLLRVEDPRNPPALAAGDCGGEPELIPSPAPPPRAAGIYDLP
jgi:DNA polymerase-3 subunit epsilon